MEIEMKIRGLMMDPVTNMPLVVLKDAGGTAILPIWVGIYEANAIALEIEKVQTPRPMTHDLLKNLLLGLNVRVHKVVVNELKEDTFYALIWMERDGQNMNSDSGSRNVTTIMLERLPNTLLLWTSSNVIIFFLSIGAALFLRGAMQFPR